MDINPPLQRPVSALLELGNEHTLLKSTDDDSPPMDPDSDEPEYEEYLSQNPRISPVSRKKTMVYLIAARDHTFCMRRRELNYCKREGIIT